MICSLILQISYIRFKRKSFPTKGEILGVKKNLLFWKTDVLVIHEKSEYQTNLFEFNAQNEVGKIIDIMYVPQDITSPDKSILISKVLTKLNLYFFDKPTVLTRKQSPTYLSITLLLLGMIISFMA